MECDDITRLLAPDNCKQLAVPAPGEPENTPFIEVRNLLRRPACQRLYPKIVNSVLRRGVGKRLAIVGPFDFCGSGNIENCDWSSTGKGG